MEQGEPLQIIEFVGRGDLKVPRLNEANLDRITREVKDNPVSIVSICGPARQGKSFLLNYILRCLSALERNDDDLAGWNKETEPLKGFGFTSGSKPSTVGIWMWSKPFILRSEKGGGNVAVLVMDTQGTNSEFTSKRDISTILGLSLLISSVTILNFSGGIREDVLKKMNLYLEYGRLSGSDEHPFSTLEIVVRDWCYPEEFRHGDRGGKEYLKEKMEVKAGQPMKAKYFRENVRKCFQQVNCFLFPNVTNSEGGGTGANFKGSYGELSSSFARFLEKFLSSVGTSARMYTKTMNGGGVDASNLKCLFDRVTNLFGGDVEPTAEDILEVMSGRKILPKNNFISTSPAAPAHHQPYKTENDFVDEVFNDIGNSTESESVSDVVSVVYNEFHSTSVGQDQNADEEMNKIVTNFSEKFRAEVTDYFQSEQGLDENDILVTRGLFMEHVSELYQSTSKPGHPKLHEQYHQILEMNMEEMFEEICGNYRSQRHNGAEFGRRSAPPPPPPPAKPSPDEYVDIPEVDYESEEEPDYDYQPEYQNPLNVSTPVLLNDHSAHITPAVTPTEVILEEGDIDIDDENTTAPKKVNIGFFRKLGRFMTLGAAHSIDSDEDKVPQRRENFNRRSDEIRPNTVYASTVSLPSSQQSNRGYVGGSSKNDNGRPSSLYADSSTSSYLHSGKTGNSHPPNSGNSHGSESPSSWPVLLRSSGARSSSSSSSSGSGSSSGRVAEKNNNRAFKEQVSSSIPAGSPNLSFQRAQQTPPSLPVHHTFPAIRGRGAPPPPPPNPKPMRNSQGPPPPHFRPPIPPSIASHSPVLLPYPRPDAVPPPVPPVISSHSPVRLPYAPPITSPSTAPPPPPLLHSPGSPRSPVPPPKPVNSNRQSGNHYPPVTLPTLCPTPIISTPPPPPPPSPPVTTAAPTPSPMSSNKDLLQAIRGFNKNNLKTGQVATRLTTNMSMRNAAHGHFPMLSLQQEIMRRRPPSMDDDDSDTESSVSSSYWS